MNHFRFLEACDVFSATVKDLGINQSSLIHLARSLNALSQGLNKLMTQGARVIVKDFLEFFHHFGVVGGEINAHLFCLAVRVVLLAQRVLKYNVVVLTEELMQFEAHFVILDGAGHCELICRVHGRILSLIPLSSSDVVFHHLQVQLEFLNLISDVLLLFVCGREFFELLISFLHLKLLHFVFITLDLSCKDFTKSKVDHFFELQHENVLFISQDVLVESHLGVIVASKQNSDRHQKCFFLDIKLLLIRNEIADKVYGTKFIEHVLLHFDFRCIVNPIFGFPFESGVGHFLIDQLNNFTDNLETH